MNRSPVAHTATGVLRVISRLGHSKRGANYWWATSELPVDLEGDTTPLTSGGRCPHSHPRGLSGSPHRPAPARGAPRPAPPTETAAPGVPHLPRVVVLATHVYSLVHIAV